MKRALIVTVMLGIAGCGVNRASQAVECNSDNTCDDSTRQCVEGWCIPNGGGIADASDGDGDMSLIDASDIDAESGIDAGCPSPCTNCNGTICTVNCNLANCDVPIVCPAGFDCQVQCQSNDCNAGIDCSASTSCTITCPGNACNTTPISCPVGGRCNVLCTANNSCKAAIDCSQSCACTTTCQHPLSCGGDAFSCPTGCQADDECTATGTGCDTCP